MLACLLLFVFVVLELLQLREDAVCGDTVVVVGRVVVVPSQDELDPVARIGGGHGL